MRLRKLVLALVVSAMGLMAFAVAANAEVYPPDPQTTNVPYVAWAGESVRVAKCFGAGEDMKGDAQTALDGAGLDIHSILTRGLFNIEDWSGDPQQKPVFTNAPTGDVVPTIERFGHGDYITRLCYSVNMTSQKAGMAVVKLSVRPDLLGLFPGLQVAAQHQFLVIWLKSQAPVIHEVGDKEPGGWSINDDGGNPTAKFQPPYEGGLTKVNGLVKINVKGTFPLGNNFAGSVATDTITLPDQWDTLAKLFAIDKSTNVPGRAYMRWDIHDSSNGLGLPGSDLGHALGYPLPFSNIFDAGADEHHVNSFCKAAENEATDAVDNCLGIGIRYTDAQLADAETASWSDLGPFSNIYGGHVAIGPFDPLRPFTSLFSDGLLNAGDAPMPALQVDVALGDGSIGALGCSYDATDSGFCSDSQAGWANKRADKDDIYVQDPTVHDWYPHNLYAPFYKQLIPPVGIAGWQDPHAALDFAEYYEGRSGVAGSFANNYPGFLGEGIYDNWEAMATAGRKGYNACNDPSGDAYPTPTGASAVTVYTDEHGEAYVRFYPYRGLDLSPDGNNRCDLSPGLYGSATIQAESIYPDQPVLWDHSVKTSNVLTKNAYHLASKVLKCVPKGVNEAFCVETILDFNGDPISNAQVKFTTSGDAANVDVDSVEFGGFDTRNQGVDVNPDDVGNDYAVLRTNSLGQAGILVTHSQNVCIDITTENLGTKYTSTQPGVKRFFEFNPHTGLACGTSTGGGPTTDPGTPGTTPPPTDNNPSAAPVANTTAVVVSLGGPVIQAQPQLTVGAKPVVLNKAAAKLFSVKVLQTKAGRFLVVNVKATKAVKTAKIRFTIMGKNGKVLKTIVRTVPTNKAFKIANYKLAKTAVSVRASLLAA
jgi:hypothetical protein